MHVFLRHALLWISIYVVYTYMMSSYDDLYPRMLANLVNVPLFMAAYYLLKHVQIPHLYNRGKMGDFILSLLVSSLA
ncbi:MAG: hypothetical protein KDC44_21410, partial [Phaeodactylibacter sp.]|nr:hypothetical protein [Phaeodactylibacter sp.]